MGLSVLFGPLQDLLNTFQSERRYADDKREAALFSINKALIETKHYIETTGGANSSERAKEYELATALGRSGHQVEACE